MSETGETPAKVVPAPHLTCTARVLVVDKSEALRASIEEIVRVALPQSQIMTVASGPEALGILRADGADLVVIDVDLPLLSGIDVIATARREGKNPFVILTSKVVLPNWAAISNELNAYEFIKKPFADGDLSQLLHSYARMMVPTRIMIADAVERTRMLVRRVVAASRFACEFDEVDDGAHALKLARISHFDVALIDVNLRGVSGLEAACQMQIRHPEMAVVVMLPGGENMLVTSLKPLGLPQVLIKPFFALDIDALLHEVHKLRRPYLLNAMLKAQNGGTLRAEAI